MPVCRRLFSHQICLARAIADSSAGISMAARMPMIAITVSSSMSVNASNFLLSASNFINSNSLKQMD